ncbi:hypothetical protein OH77DRAFT_920314 [Trametes cingulata]|nr:hypothetical protein OH77DRAFT_920314 [Trametes cingulata]
MRSPPSVGSRTVILCVCLLDTLRVSCPSVPPYRLSACCSYITLKTSGLPVSLFSSCPFAFRSMYYPSYLASRIASSADACARRVRCITNDVL